MGSIGNCYDNAVIELFWGRTRTELLNRQRWKTRLKLANRQFEYLDIFHNRQPATGRSACSPPNGHEKPHTPAAPEPTNIRPPNREHITHYGARGNSVAITKMSGFIGKV
jgi:hypothetical protein